MNILNIITVLFAIAAAVLWLLSARVKTPNKFSIFVARPVDQEPLGGNPLGGKHLGYGHSPDLIKLAESLSKQSKLSACGAILAAISAITQAISVFSS